MTLEELQTELNGPIHQTVTFKRIAANSIIIYFFGEPGDDGIRLAVRRHCALGDGSHINRPNKVTDLAICVTEKRKQK
jgi:hypothetical protein